MKHLKLYSVLSLAILVLAGCGGPTSVPPQAEDEATAPQTRATEGESPAGPAGRSAGEAPEPPAAPDPVVVTVPTGTVVEVAFLDSVSSKESQPGDSFRARVIQDVMQDGLAVIPAGSVVVGTVVEAVPLKKRIGGKARLVLEFSKLELTSGRSTAISAAFAELGKSETKRDAATIGGAAAGGALLGRILKKKDRDKGALIGAVIGAAAGTAIAARTEGEEVLIDSGTQISLQLNEPAHVTVRP